MGGKKTKVSSVGMRRKENENPEREKFRLSGKNLRLGSLKSTTVVTLRDTPAQTEMIHPRAYNAVHAHFDASTKSGGASALLSMGKDRSQSVNPRINTFPHLTHHVRSFQSLVP